LALSITIKAMKLSKPILMPLESGNLVSNTQQCKIIHYGKKQTLLGSQDISKQQFTCSTLNRSWEYWFMIILNPTYMHRQQQQIPTKLKQKEHSTVDGDALSGKDLTQIRI